MKKNMCSTFRLPPDLPFDMALAGKKQFYAQRVIAANRRDTRLWLNSLSGLPKTRERDGGFSVTSQCRHGPGTQDLNKANSSTA